MEQQTAQNRMIQYDLLRILAAFSVVMLHVSAQFWYDTPVTDASWLIANSYNAAFRFGVPIFVMISGALFLSPARETNIRRLYTHNILRLLVLYIVWSCVYGLYDCFALDISTVPLGGILREMLYGRYHLWYLPMLIGIYMLLPILKIWTEHAQKRDIEYFLLLFLIFQIGKETVNALFPYSEVVYTTSLIAPYMVCGYLGYFILGCYLSRYGIPVKYKKLLYLLAIPAVLCNIFLSCRISLWKGQPTAGIDDSFGVFTFIIVTALFLFVTDRAGRHSFNEKTGRMIREISRDTLGVYVMHIGLIECLQPLGIHSMTLPNLIGVPLFAVLIYCICTAASALLRRIPAVGKFIC